MMATDRKGVQVIAKNRKASHEYHLLERFEAGLALTGTEIKSVRAHRVSLRRAFVQPRAGELWLLEAHIAEYEHGNRENHEPTRPRKLLLHRREINKIIDELTLKGVTMVPTRLYLRDGRAKVEVALARGKKLFDKRADLREKESKRQIERAMKEKYGS